MVAGERTNVRSLYLYLVCLVALIIVIFSTVSMVRNVVQLLYPDPGYGGYLAPAIDGRGDQAAQDAARQRRQAQDSQRHQAVLGLVGSGTALLVAGPLYLYHWRRVQLELPGAQGSAGGEPPTSRG
ncbi:MAG: hypothetical protein NVS3B26_28990 [Mycobacteriales bacterium]